MPNAMPPLTVGIHSPGDMGAAVGQVLAAHSVTVLAALEGRSGRTRSLAKRAGIADVSTLPQLVARADLVLSILVPAQAEDAARHMAAALAKRPAGAAAPLYVDCNAIAASTSTRMAAVIEAAGGRYVDASIIGPPPRKPGVTRFYASGPHAGDFAVLAARGLDVRVLEGAPTAASSLKTCYAAFTKGLQALTTELLVSARAAGVGEPLDAELQQNQSALLEWMGRTLPGMPAKAHRWVGEMEEHGRAFADQGLPPHMMQGAAELYRWIATTARGQAPPEDGPAASLDVLVSDLAAALHPPSGGKET